MCPNDLSIRRKYFKFLSSWIDHEDFEQQVKAAWINSDDWNSNISRMTCNLKSWNKSVFGNIFKRKEMLIRRLEGIQKKLVVANNDRLIHLRNEFWKEYVSIINQEEAYWSQQVRCKWVLQGDNNTGFFHQYALIKRRHNRIVALLNSDGVWIYDDMQLQHTVTEFYSSLYTSAGLPVMTFTTQSSFPQIPDSDLFMLKSSITFEETKKALFSMQNLKAPGPDDFHPIFFKSQWDIIGSSLQMFPATRVDS